jgi:hypothetical protein
MTATAPPLGHRAPAPPPRRAGRAAALVVWGLWLALLLGALRLVASYGSDVPSWDDWDMVPVLTHAQPVSAEWLWSQHNEHRVPLPRLLFLGLNRLVTVDFRVTMYADVLAVGLLAAAFLWAAARLRGRTSLANGFFPLVLLEPGQAVNMLWGWQLEFFVSAVLGGVAVLAIALAGTALSVRRAAVIVGVCALLLPLTGANGLGMVPALALWPLGLALLPGRWTGAGERRGDRLLLGLGLGALALTALYFVGWERVPHHPRAAGIFNTVKTSVQFVTIGLGPATRDLWPLMGLAVVACFGATAVMLLRVWRDRPAERARAGGLLLGLGALGCLAFGLGMGRNGFEVRYVTLAVPAWCLVWLAWAIYGGARWSRGMPSILAATALLALWGNVRFGLDYARDLRSHLAAFEADLRAGVPRRELVRRYDPYLHPHQDIPLEYLPMLRRAGIGLYRGLREDPPVHEVPLDLVPSGLAGVTWRDSVATVVAVGDPHVDFTVPVERYVAGIRLEYQYQGRDGGLPLVGIRWTRAADREYPAANYKKYSPTGDRANWERGTWTRIGDSTTTMTVALADTIGRIRLQPNYLPGMLRVKRLVLLVPAE